MTPGTPTNNPPIEYKTFKVPNPDFGEVEGEKQPGWLYRSAKLTDIVLLQFAFHILYNGEGKLEMVDGVPKLHTSPIDNDKMPMIWISIN